MKMDEKCKQDEFLDLAERFRSATDPEEVKKLGDQMGRMIGTRNASAVDML